MANIFDWHAESVHAIIFVQSTNLPSVSELYTSAFNAAPQSSSENTHPQIGKTGTAATVLDNQISKSVNALPGRVELVIQSAGDGPDGYPMKIDDPRSAIEEIVGAAQKVVASLKEISRIAVHCRLVKNFEVIEQANAQISKIIPFTYEPASKRDFLFQINHATKINDIELNRILKYSVEAVQVITGVAPFGMFTGSPMAVKNIWASVIHLDFNTIVPRTRSFTSDEATAALEVAGKEVIHARKNNLRL